MLRSDKEEEGGLWRGRGKGARREGSEDAPPHFFLKSETSEKRPSLVLIMNAKAKIRFRTD